MENETGFKGCDGSAARFASGSGCVVHAAFENHTGDKTGQTKEALRDAAKALRRSISAHERDAVDAAIRDQVLGSFAFQEADIVLTYLSFGAEVDTRGIIEAAWMRGKKVALPRCVGPRLMRWFEIDGFEHLERSAFGMQEPGIDVDCEVDPTSCTRAIAIVPGLSFDNEGYRLGYGGGYYDAFLAEFNGVSMGLCRHAQLSDESLPRDEHDRHVDIVVTEASCMVTPASAL